MRSLIAHQGGWDEILILIAPLILAIVAIGAFERRGRRRQRDHTEQRIPDDQENGSPD
jgi:hypothetical protein